MKRVYLETTIPWLIFSKGKVKWFEKNNGYITTDGGLDIFVSAENVKRGHILEKDKKVRFYIGQSDRGLCACNVEVIK